MLLACILYDTNLHAAKACSSDNSRGFEALGRLQHSSHHRLRMNREERHVACNKSTAENFWSIFRRTS